MTQREEAWHRHPHAHTNYPRSTPVHVFQMNSPLPPITTYPPKNPFVPSGCLTSLSESSNPRCQPLLAQLCARGRGVGRQQGTCDSLSPNCVPGIVMDTSYVVCELCSTAPIFHIWKLRLCEVRQKEISDFLQGKH